MIYTEDIRRLREELADQYIREGTLLGNDREGLTIGGLTTNHSFASLTPPEAYDRRPRPSEPPRPPRPRPGDPQ